MEDSFKDFQFPKIRNILPKLLSDEIQGMSAEQCRDAFKKMFEGFEKDFGIKVIINGGDLPVNTLFPKENIEKEEK